MEAAPDVLFAYNERYDQTNTSKSLLRALRLSGPVGVLWLNGDVVFDPAILDAVRPQMSAGESFVCVNTAATGDEEIKYTVDAEGLIRELSKTVDAGLGEAVGINFVGPADKELLCKHLEACDDTDYFERAIETAVAAGMRIHPVDISAFYAVEVDFAADLDRANEVTSGG
jgi:CDP-glycerol glycerophosphotransferase